MIAEELKKLLRAVPFQPFTVFMASEKAFEVPHPDYAMLSPNGRIMVVADEGTDTVDILDVPLISRVKSAGREGMDS